MRDFLSERAYVTIYDPKVDDAQIWLDLSEACPNVPLANSTTSRFVAILTRLTGCAVQKQVTIARSSLEACKNKEAIVIATEWKEFREIDWQTVYDHMNKPAFVFDGRMIVDADALKKIGFKVRGLTSLLIFWSIGQC